MRFILSKKHSFVLPLILSTGLVLCIVCCMCSMFSKPIVARAEVPKIELISSFYTYYGYSSKNRAHNVELAVSKIDGITVYPEDEFSFNDVVGPRREERGFKSAYVIQDGEFVEGVGGGVCQVSSTLYNAVLLADLAVTKVHAHSLPVSYVAPSFDAMVSSASDFCFVNTLSQPITIKAEADGKYVRFSIYGVKGRKVTRQSETIETLDFETVYRDDDTILFGEEVVHSNGAQGLRSRGYLEYEEGDKVVTRLIRTDFYAPQNRIILRGTKPAGIEQGGIVPPTPTT